MKNTFTSFLVFACIAVLSSSGCDCLNTRQTLNKAEETIETAPYEAWSVLSTVDSTALKFKPHRLRHTLLMAKSLDLMHINDGQLRGQMEEVSSWYRWFGNKNQKFQAIYYYCDQLKDAGEMVEAAIELSRLEKESANCKKWVNAGMAAKLLCDIYSETGNHSDEIASVQRAIIYYRNAGMDENEAGVRIKLAKAFYNSGQLDKADSVYESTIPFALEKQKVKMLSAALAGSADVLLDMKPSNGEKALERLAWAERLGYNANSRFLANKAFALALTSQDEKYPEEMEKAHSSANDESQKEFVMRREYQIKEALRDTNEAYPILQRLLYYSDTVTMRRIGISVEKAQNAFLESTNEKLRREKRAGWTIAFLLVLLMSALSTVGYVVHRRKTEKKKIEEEERLIALEQYSFACEELGSLGLDSLDRISEAYDSPENLRPKYLLEAYEKVTERFRKDKDFQRRFLDNVDKTHENAIIRLKVQVPELSDSQILLFAYLIQGFSYTTISVLMAKKRQYIYDRRWNLVKTITDSNPTDKDFFLSCIPNRPTRVKKG